MKDDSLLYRVALSMVPGIGGVLARNLVAYVGSVEGIFREPVHKLVKIPGIGEVNAHRIRESGILSRAAEELQYIEKNGISAIFYLDDNFPRRFRNCPDAPVLFYYKGTANLDAARVISIVGTRNATDYGRQMCDELLKELSARGYDLLVVSGLAYGIDIQAHKSSLKYNLPTVGVLGHGLDKLYPSEHVRTAKAMLEKGGLMSDFPSKTKIDPPNFIRRNRLIAGLSDAVVVVESGEKGGALITADIGASYDRDVCAFPGRAGDIYSRGCNQLIKKNIAALIENAADLEYVLGWEDPRNKGVPVQQQLFVELTGDQQNVVDQLKKEEKIDIDNLASELEMPVRKLSSLLLELEFKGVVTALPGNQYKIKA
jgi:DNA processing protein